MKGNLVLACLFAGAAALVVAMGLSAQEPAKTGSDGSAVRDQVKVQEQILLRQFKEFEESLVRLKRRLAASDDPDDKAKAELLDRVIEKARDESIVIQFEQISAALKDQKFANVNEIKLVLERTRKLSDDLQVLLALMREDPRYSRDRAEAEWLKQMIKMLDQAIRDQKSVQARTEFGKATAGELQTSQKKVTDLTGKIAEALEKMAKNDQGGEGKDTKGNAKPGEAKEGSKSGESKNAGKESKSAESKEGKGGEGKEGSAKGSESKAGSEGKSGPKEGSGEKKEPGSKEPGSKEGGEKSPVKEKTSEAKPGAKEGEGGKSKESSGAEAKSGPKSGDQDSKPGEAKSGDSKSGQGQPKSGDPQSGEKSASKSGQESGDDQPKTPQVGKKQVKDANDYQKEAENKIAKKENRPASDEQGKAIKSLEDAKKKLEALLIQIREEETERLLAALQLRCEKMLAMQIRVQAGTVDIYKTVEKRSPKTPIDEDKRGSLGLSDQEKEIVSEASKAIEMLEAEGSAVAFPEVFQQVREDMKIVQRRLEITDISPVTQGIEQDIVDTLREMIEALKKARQDNKEQKAAKGGKSGEGQPADPKLLEQIAELKMIRSMQIRVNTRTQVYAKTYVERDGEQAREVGIRRELQDLSDRQERIYDITNRISKGDNR